MFCDNCGNKLPVGAKFCGSCGANLSAYEKDDNPNEAWNNYSVNRGTKKSNYENKINNNKENTNEKNSKKVNFTKGKSKKRLSKRTTIAIISVISGIIVLLIVGVILYNLIVVPMNEHNQLIEDCESSINETKLQKNDLNKKISGAEYTYNNISRDAVVDPTLFERLSENINKSKETYSSVVVDENIPVENDALIDKIKELDNQKEQLRASWVNLDNADSAIYNSKNAKADEATQLVERCNEIGKDNQGYEFQTIVKTTGWIKGTDKEVISKAWKNAKGHMDAPEISSFSSHSSNNKKYNNETCCVLIGCVEFQNKTSNFHISETNKKSPYLSILFSGGGAQNDSQACFSWVVNYTKSADGSNNSGNVIDNPEYGSKFLGSSWNTTIAETIVRSEMYKDNWGPVAFMIVLPEVFNPNYPNGIPALDTLKLSFAGFPSLGNTSYLQNTIFLPKKNW